MKKLIFAAVCMIWLAAAAGAGEISAGAVPGSINYQGRLERDNAPITGLIRLHFKIYNAAAGGTLRWTSPEIEANAAQGIFSASITPAWDVFSHGETLYLEVQVESEILTPREPLSSVAYAIVAKKLEDGASISVTTITANSQTVNGVIQLSGVGSKICFNTNNCLVDATVATAAGGITAPGNSSIESGIGGVGIMSFKTSNIERMQIKDNLGDGRVAIGTQAISNPMGTLDVDGSLYVGNAGIYDRDDGEINIKEDLVVEGGAFRGTGNNYITMGETANTLIAATDNTPRMWLDSSGNLGVGAAAAAAERIHSSGNIRSDTGLRGNAASVGAYTGWASLDNEVRAANSRHLLLQQSNSYNVGIGTNTPTEKLHVKGSIRAEKGVIASTAAFSGAVNVDGNFSANGHNQWVYLSTTIIYGTLQVTGGIGSMAGLPAYLASTQTFTGQNTFVNQVAVSSDIITPSRLGVAVKDFDFPGSRYLQVGDNKSEYEDQDTSAYLVGGSAADAKLLFYRGPTLAGTLETQNGANLALVVGGQTKTLTDAVYHRIQNSVVWISTGFAGTPAIYVSSLAGNVGIGTVVSDPTNKLTVNGSLRLTGAGSGIIFPSGNVMSDPGSIAASAIANAGDALVTANTLGGGGSVILRNNSVDGLVVDTGGNIGVGTPSPIAKLNVRGGDLVLGAPASTYGANGVEDLIVAGSMVFDGALVQRSASAVQLSNLIVAGDVYLSTGTGRKTGIGTSAPYTMLDVNGTAQFGLGVTKSTFTAAGALQLATPLLAIYGGTGNATGLAATASALATDPADCALPNVALGVNAAGVAQCSQPSNVSGSAATVTGAAQAAITSVGTLTGLTMGGTLAMGVNNITGTGSISATTFNGALNGNADTASALSADPVDCVLPNVVRGMSAAGVAVCSQPSNVSGSAATVTGAAQAAITSVGTLTGLTMGGTLAMGANNITGTGSISATTFNGALNGNADTASALSADPVDCVLPNVVRGMSAAGVAVCSQPSNVSGSAATVTGAAQAAITSVGTLTGLTMGGTLAMGVNNITGTGSISATTFNGALNGNADTASAMANNGASGKVVCWRSSGVLGQCSDVPTALGCTCAATP